MRERVETVYALEGFASIPRSDLTGRLRWWGLYTQRKPGIDGGKTATLEPEELEDEYFMMRVRSDGGRLTLAQLRTIATISTEFGRDTADISDRQNIQLHWIRIEDVPEIWRRLEAVGLSSAEACGDVPRVILGSPVAGVAIDEIIDGTPAIDEILRRHLLDPAYSNLPRKFKSAISGSPQARRGPRDQRHLLRRRGPPRARSGLRPVGRRRAVDQPAPRGAPRRLGAARGGPRRLGRRHLDLPRLRLPPPAHQGPPEVPRQGLGSRDSSGTCSRTSTSAAPLIDGPAPSGPIHGRRDHVGVHLQRDGHLYVGAAPTVGRLAGPG